MDGDAGVIRSGMAVPIERPLPSGANAAAFGSDVVADTLRALDIPYIALNPGASYRGLHDSLVNYLGNSAPQMLLCLHEESAVAIAHGYAKVTGRAMAAALHSNVGLMHATMAIFNAWCDRMPVLLIGATGPVDAAKRRPWIDWIHTARDQGALIRDYTKWDDQPASPAAAREALMRALVPASRRADGAGLRQPRRRDAGGKARRAVAPLGRGAVHAAGRERARRRSRGQGRRAAEGREEHRDADRPHLAQRGRMERARDARRGARRARHHRSENRSELPDRSSAASRRAVSADARCRRARGARRRPT